MSAASVSSGGNEFYDIDELPLTDDQKEMVLEWFAQKIWRTLNDDLYGKSYDPLVIDGRTAHSYVFELSDGDFGRHHVGWDSLAELERRLCSQMREAALELYEHEFANWRLRRG